MENFSSCLERQERVMAEFSQYTTPDARYDKIIMMGKTLGALPAEHKISENLVHGCQSIMYLYAFMQDDKVFFQAESDAIISSGLASLLIAVYSGETPETILKCPPTYLEKLGISASLTPGRANGLAALHLKMKQQALKLLIESQKKSN